MYRQLHNVGVARAKDAVEELAGRPHSAPKISKLVLSPETQRRLEILFRKGNRDAAAKLLIEECGTNLPFCEKSNEFDMERIRFAAIKLSRGDFLDLREAVELAKLDWRDLLCTAGFGSDVKAHEKWLPHKWLAAGKADLEITQPRSAQCHGIGFPNSPPGCSLASSATSLHPFLTGARNTFTGSGNL